MAEILPGWSSELERSFKEVLFRFLEEVHSTKAALYLRGPDDEFLLVTQYGFGRREMIPARHETGAALVLKAQQGEGLPIAVNHPDREPDIAELLQLAGTARMMIVPVLRGARLAGFVDVRDKGQKRPFEKGDLATAAVIAQDILRLVERTGLVAGVGSHQEVVATGGSSETVRLAGEGAVVTVLDELALEQLYRCVVEQMRLRRGLAAAAVTVATDDRVGVRMVLAQGARDDDRSPMLHHQAEALRTIGWDPPPPDVWSVRSEVAPGDLQDRGALVIGTRVALHREGWALVLSVVGLAASDEVPHTVTELVRRAREVSLESQRRFARRRLSCTLLRRRDGRLAELESHSVAVSRLAWATARELGLGLDRAEEAAVAGLLHDVGWKDLDYDALYRHPAPGEKERQAFRRHAVAGERVLFDNGLGGLAPVVRHHHERWDGEGYPDQLAGDQIPLLARVVHAAEVFEVLTSPESYRRPVSRERALDVLMTEAGRQFDPGVVEALVKVVGGANAHNEEGPTATRT